MKPFDRNPAEQALEAALDEARRVPGPELDWDTMQRKLWQAIDREPKVAPKAFSWRALWAVPALAAAVATVVWFAPHTAQSPAVAPAVVAQAGVVDGDALTSSDLLRAGPQGLHISHRGRAEWELAANATARVEEHDHVVRIRLLAGSLRAEVVPTLEKERFVVEAAGTRVAVHGTVFRVAISEDRNLVDVEEGVVAVTPLDANQPQSVILRAPSHAEFALSGVPLQSRAVAQKQSAAPIQTTRPGRRWTPSTPAPVSASAPIESAEAIAAQPAPPLASDREPAPLPQRLNIGEVEEGVAPVVEAITACFRESTPNSHTLKVTAQSAVTLSVAPDGSIEQVSFDPPLSPSVQGCTEHALTELRFAPSLEGASVTRVLELTR